MRRTDNAFSREHVAELTPQLPLQRLGALQPATTTKSSSSFLPAPCRSFPVRDQVDATTGSPAYAVLRGRSAGPLGPSDRVVNFTKPVTARKVLERFRLDSAEVGGRRSLVASIGYTVQPAADGSGEVVSLSGADPIARPAGNAVRGSGSAAAAARPNRCRQPIRSTPICPTRSQPAPTADEKPTAARPQIRLRSDARSRNDMRGVRQTLGRRARSQHGRRITTRRWPATDGRRTAWRAPSYPQTDSSTIDERCGSDGEHRRRLSRPQFATSRYHPKASRRSDHKLGISRRAGAFAIRARPIVEPMSAPYVPLRVFSSFTMLEGAIEPKAIAKQAKKLGFPGRRAHRPQRPLCGNAVRRRLHRPRACSRSSARCWPWRGPTTSGRRDAIDWLVLLAQDEAGYAQSLPAGFGRASRPAGP